MDGDDLFALFGYLLIAPFWLAWKFLVLLWQFVLKPANQALADSRANKQQEGLAQQNQDRQLARDAVRAKQLAALRAAAPQSPADRMRATIHLNEFKVAKTENKRVRRVLAEDAWITVEVGESTCYSVDMILQMSETDRAIIQESQLEFTVIEDNPAVTPRQLEEAEARYQGEIDAAKDPYLKVAIRGSTEDALKAMKQRREQTRLGDYLVSPFSRTFITAHEAKQYADRLKTKVLPSVKELVESYRVHAAQQTVEF